MSDVDGNAIGALLYEAFGVDMTAAHGTCARCGASNPLACAHVYRGVGTVLRCPSCRHALMIVARVRGWFVVDALGMAELQSLA